MNIIKYPTKENWNEILARPAFDSGRLDEKVSAILRSVELEGDTAVARWTEEFDGVLLEENRVSEREFIEAEANVSDELKEAIALARSNIEKFHSAYAEPQQKIETTPGVVCWRRSAAIESVGLYVPGGTAPLFSTVLMLVVPAKIAGCNEIIVCSPPDKNGKINDAILFAARLCGATKVFKIGGVQAIGAMAYGTKTVPRVYKIFGPGNQFVTAAKQMVSQKGIAIDMPAGPSEVAVFADRSSNHEFVAADLLSQAEHGPDSQVLLVSTSETMISESIAEIEKQIAVLPRREIAGKALENSKAILVENEETAIELLNQYAAEHLILAIKNPEIVAERITNAGSVFIGNYSCESAGDYASGTNHTLPTNGYARAFSGVSLDSFVKKITFQQLTEAGIENIGGAIEIMAEAEGLHAHKNAITVRLREIESSKGAGSSGSEIKGQD
ncbi:MAG: histidinol dehydrogenase [Acidobacteria bacterium]|nr:histidinol dehydrogenase [Acidobacteriota bacterium]